MWPTKNSTTILLAHRIDNKRPRQVLKVLEAAILTLTRSSSRSKWKSFRTWLKTESSTKTTFCRQTWNECTHSPRKAKLVARLYTIKNSRVRRAHLGVKKEKVTEGNISLVKEMSGLNMNRPWDTALMAATPLGRMAKLLLTKQQWLMGD